MNANMGFLFFANCLDNGVYPAALVKNTIWLSGGVKKADLILSDCSHRSGIRKQKRSDQTSCSCHFFWERQIILEYYEHKEKPDVQQKVTLSLVRCKTDADEKLHIKTVVLVLE